MTIALVINGVTFPYPEQGDEDWGPTATDWAAAVTNGMLQKAGGTFTLTADVDFGASFGLKSLYYKTRTANLADAGQFRLAHTDVVSWRNQTNSANLDLGVNSSNQLTFNGSAIQPILTIGDLTDVGTDGITITGGIGAVIGSGASISQHVADTTHNGYLSSTDWNTFNGKQAAGNYITALTGDVTASGPGSVTATIANNAVTNAKLAQVATATFKGRTTAGTGNVEDLTATQATALLNVMVGDSGSGGTKGLVPAPATGDATKFLNGAGVWATPAGAGDVTGPGSATANAIALFNGTTGKIIKDGGIGNGSQILVGGTTPGFSNTITGNADIVQLTILGNSTQTNAIFSVQKSDTTVLLNVTNTTGTQIRGTTTTSVAAAGFVGEVLTSGSIGTGVTITSSVSALGSLLVTKGNWILFGTCTYSGNGGNTYFDMNISNISGDTGGTYGLDKGLGIVNTGSGVGGTIFLAIPVNIGSDTTYYMNCSTQTASAGSGGIKGSIKALRIT